MSAIVNPNADTAAADLAQVGLGRIEADAERVGDLLRQTGGPVWVTGPHGSGRSTMVELLRTRLPGARTIHAPAMSLDAPAHLFHQMLHLSGLPAVVEASRDRAVAMGVRACPTLEAIQAQGGPLIVALGAGWAAKPAAGGEPGDDDDLDHARRRGAELTAAMTRYARQHREWHVVFVCDSWTQGVPKSRRVELKPARAPVSYLTRAERWGEFADDATALHKHLGGPGVWLHPVALRVGACAVALGRLYREPEYHPRKVARRLENSETLDAADALAIELAQRLPDFGAAVLRLSRARFDLPRAWLRDLLPEDACGDARRVVLDCLVYGDETARVSLPLRRAASRAREGRVARRDADDHSRAAHEVLSAHHRQLDGVSSWRESRRGSFHWLERIHHATHGSDASLETVLNSDLGHRELYWSLGRSLSVRGRLDVAVDVFQRCLEKIDPADTYAHHYLAFNLDKAGRDPARAEAHFRRAVDGDGQNVWWRSRWVTWLIHQGRPAEARRAWEAGLAHLDPSGERLNISDSLAWNYHRWVCEAALGYGQRALARQVLDALPDRLFEREPVFSALRRRLKIAEFVDRYGHAIHPETVPIDEYWNRPAWLPTCDVRGVALSRWYPGRVLAAGPDTWEFALGEPEAGRAGTPRILGLRLQHAPQVAGPAPLESGQFVHALRSDDDVFLFVPVYGLPLNADLLEAGRALVRYLSPA